MTLHDEASDLGQRSEDDENDRPRDGIAGDNDVPELAIARLVLLQERATGEVSGHHACLPGNFREVSGWRVAAVSCLSSSVDCGAGATFCRQSITGLQSRR